jgi:hypothetical protein
MRTEECFAEFKFKSSSIKNFIEMFKKTDIRIREWNMTYPVDQKYWNKEPLLSKINQKFKIKKCGIIYMKPYTCYDWHTDFTRGVCINWLIEHTNSFTLFGKNKDDLNLDIIKVPYESNHFFLFNNQISHSVTNFEGNRYLFTSVFEKEKDDLSYEEVYTWCKNEELFT